MSSSKHPPAPPSAASQALSPDDLALLRASVAFQLRWITDPRLRVALERTAGKLGSLAEHSAAA